MKKSLSVMCASSILMIAGCRKDEPAPPVEPAVQETVLVASTDTNQAFTPPEIRRAYDSTRRGADSVAQAAASAKKVDTVAVATPAPPAPVPPPPAPTPKAPEPKTAAAPAPATKPAPKVLAPAAPVAIPAGIVEPGSEGDWVIQVGIHKSEEGAQGKVEKLGGIGIPAYVVQAATNAGLSGSYWRVRVGRWVKRVDAQAYGESVLKPAGYNFWVDRKSNELASAGGNP